MVELDDPSREGPDPDEELEDFDPPEDLSGEDTDPDADAPEPAAGVLSELAEAASEPVPADDSPEDPDAVSAGVEDVLAERLSLR